MFQEDRVADADRLLRTVVRKNPTYAGIAMQHLLDSDSFGLLGCCLLGFHCICLHGKGTVVLDLS